MKVYLKNVRQCYNVWKPFKGESGELGKYNCKFIFPPNHPAVAQLEAAFVQLAKEEYGAKWEATLKAIKANNGTCLKDGNAKADQEGFAGNMFVNVSSEAQPTTFDGRTNPPTPTTRADGIPYSGAYVDAILEVWTQNNEYGKKFNAQITGIMFRADGDSFGGGEAPPASESEWQNDDISVGGVDPLTQ